MGCDMGAFSWNQIWWGGWWGEKMQKGQNKIKPQGNDYKKRVKYTTTGFNKMHERAKQHGARWWRPKRW